VWVNRRVAKNEATSGFKESCCTSASKAKGPVSCPGNSYTDVSQARIEFHPEFSQVSPRWVVAVYDKSFRVAKTSKKEERFKTRIGSLKE
jgi:hypothetical protein